MAGVQFHHGGTDAGRQYAAIFTEQGVQPTEEYYQRGTTNFAPIAQRIMLAKPAAVEMATERLGTLVGRKVLASNPQAGLKPQFDKLNTKIIGLSVDPVTNHSKWAKDIEETQGHAVTFPMIGDPELKVATAYDMLPEGAGTTSDGRTAADNATSA